MLRSSFLLLVLTSAAAFGQGMVEAGAITGSGASAIGAAGKGLGRSIGGILDKVEGTVDGAAKSQAPASHSPAGRKASQRAVYAPPRSRPAEVEDTRSSVKPDDVKAGMSKAELFAAAGKPYTKITMDDEGRCVEKLTYMLKGGGRMRIELVDAKITEVEQVPE